MNKIIKNDMALFVDGKFNIFHGDKLYLWQGSLSYKNQKITRDMLLCVSLNTHFLVSDISGIGVFLIFDLQSESVNCYSSVHNTEYVFFFRRGTNIYFLIGMEKVISVIGKPCCNINSIKKTPQ